MPREQLHVLLRPRLNMNLSRAIGHQGYLLATAMAPWMQLQPILNMAAPVKLYHVRAGVGGDIE
jgi:hypothetical protein